MIFEVGEKGMQSILEEARGQYAILENICDTIVITGNWTKVDTNDVRLFLNMYIQALLLRMAQADEEFGPRTLQFIGRVAPKDLLNITGATVAQAKNAAYKNRSFAQGIPLLLRCCIAHDEKDKTKDSEAFIGALTRLLQLQAACEEEMSERELNFITSYIGELRTFVATRAAGALGNIAAKENAANANAQAENAQAQVQEAPQKEEKTLEELRAELDGLIGLTQVKKEVETLINLIRVRKMREEHGLANMDMSFHMVFTGNPGTGKTTVARLIAGIYKQLGFLSKGQLIETDRAGLVAGYVGQTAGKVTEVVKSALGGILFIDEAYALARKGMENDFGKEAIDTLVKLMEDNRDDLVVIVAGYTNEMHTFLTSNPGLISRFNKYIDFPDYTDDELMDILKMRADKQGYVISKEANTHVRRFLLSMTYDERMDFGNARGIRNVLEKLVQAQANRLAADTQDVTVEKLQALTKADAREACPIDGAAQDEDEAEEVV